MRLLFNVMVTLALIAAGLMAIFTFTAPPQVEANFAEKAPNFFVLARTSKGYQKIKLAHALANPSDYQFWLDQEEVALNVGDIHHIRVLQSDRDSQLIRFNYVNSYSSTSIYRVSKDQQLTPVSYEINHQMGQGVIVMIAFIPLIFIARWLAKLLANRLFPPAIKQTNSST
ncbi:hypothetical protein Q4519_13600 [Motilimonas sp. 1_MG-2023]|uniref:hypothetical protein n=1 Tax=Motilimonas sp. 1_MG-2023 TaxID=3062672 RepID=UPI0026E2037A|nr:hypothetical protein [Motilimonas sp. 1_MG-2023]MDO6526721.1 hypothetical protein [Motilimonas sp. 1_MG-2023]